jgi:hypothetical protein
MRRKKLHRVAIVPHDVLEEPAAEAEDLESGRGAEAPSRSGRGYRAVDVAKLRKHQRARVVERALQTRDQDNERFLLRVRERMDRHDASASLEGTGYTIGQLDPVWSPYRNLFLRMGTVLPSHALAINDCTLRTLLHLLLQANLLDRPFRLVCSDLIV